MTEVGKWHPELSRWQVGAGSLSLSGWLCDFEQVCSILILLFSMVQVKLVWRCPAPRRGIRALSLQSEPCSTVNFTFIVTFWRYYMVMTHCSSNFCTMSLWALPSVMTALVLASLMKESKLKGRTKSQFLMGSKYPYLTSVN